MRKLVSEAYLAGITCEAFEVQRESVQTAKKLFEVVPTLFSRTFWTLFEDRPSPAKTKGQEISEDFFSSLQFLQENQRNFFLIIALASKGQEISVRAEFFKFFRSYFHSEIS